MLGKLMEAKMADEKLSYRDVGSILGMSHTTAIRASQGMAVDLETLIRICDWLEVEPATMLNSLGKSENTLANQIAVILEREPRLADAFQGAIKAILIGDVKTHIIEDIAAYISYRVSITT